MDLLGFGCVSEVRTVSAALSVTYLCVSCGYMFHLLVFVLIVIGMKYQRGTFQEQSNDGRWRRCSRQSLRMRVEKGVDVALALSIAIAPDPTAYEVVVVVTGDSDLQAAFEHARSSGKRVYVCSARNALAEDLRGFLHVEGFNRFVYLDDVILMAVGRPPKCNWGCHCPEDQQRETKHMRGFSHPCPDGIDCPIALQCAGSPDPEHREHLLAYLHACPVQQCLDDDPLHRVLFDHPMTAEQRPLCDRDDCPVLHQDPAHAAAFRHVCPLGARCKEFLTSQTRAHRRKRSSAGIVTGAGEEADPVTRHLRDYVHPCRWGASCRSCQDPLWNWEHVMEQQHGEQPTATAQQQAGGRTRRRRSNAGGNKKSKNNNSNRNAASQSPAADAEDDEDATSGLVRLMQMSDGAATLQPEQSGADVGGPTGPPPDSQKSKVEHPAPPTAAGASQVGQLGKVDEGQQQRRRSSSKNSSSGPSFLQGLFGASRRIAPEQPADGEPAK